jgi:hypothetical protein
MGAGLVVTQQVAVLLEADPDWIEVLPDLPGGAPAYF